MTTETPTGTHTEMIAGLRALADFLEQHPDLPEGCPFSVNAFVSRKEELASVARLTSWAKGYNSDYMWLSRTFRGDIKFEVNVNRELVCRKIVKGTRVVPEQTVEDIEWVCDDASLLSTK